MAVINCQEKADDVGSRLPCHLLRGGYVNAREKPCYDLIIIFLDEWI